MTCQRGHWAAWARLYDNGSLSPPVAAPMDQPAIDGDLMDRTAHRGTFGGYLRVCFWGHDRQDVLNAAQARLDEALEQRRRQGLPTP